MATRKKYRSQSSYTRLITDHEKPVGASLTMADQSYSINDLMRLNGQGIDPGVWKNGFYDGDIEEIDEQDLDFSKIQYMDLVDKAEIIQASAEMLYRAEKSFEKRQKKELEVNEHEEVNNEAENVEGTKTTQAEESTE